MADPNPKGISTHIPVLIFLQICFIILFGAFTRYDFRSGFKNQDAGEFGVGTGNPHNMILKTWPSFQDVHVMIFVGFGFLMTFLKKYGLSAVSLNLLVAALCIQWQVLVSGFLHLHYDTCEEEPVSGIQKREAGGELVHNKLCDPSRPWIDINLMTLIGADFACACVLISFGVIIGTASPLMLIVMTMIEVVLFNVNEVIGRQYFGTRDAGDTIFVHMFGAYFGLAVARMLWDQKIEDSQNKGEDKYSNLFSMIGTIFLWVYWPSFNGGTAATGDGQMRAFTNTYLSLCACAVTTFAISAGTNPKRQWVMEHIQNATLAGGVIVGACADMMLSPVGSIVAGALAGCVATLGFVYVQPFLAEKLKVTDTCGVNNLHGMPSILGGLLSVLIAGLATKEEYDQFNKYSNIPEKSSLFEIFPLNFKNSDDWEWSPGYQAGMQMAGIVVTLAFAIIGGLCTGVILNIIKKYEMKIQERWNKKQRDYLYHDDLYFYRESYDNEIEDEELINSSKDLEMIKNM